MSRWRRASALITPNFGLGFDFLCALTGAGRKRAKSNGAEGRAEGRICFQRPSGRPAPSRRRHGWNVRGGVEPVLTLTANAVDALSYAVLSTADYILCSFVADIR